MKKIVAVSLVCAGLSMSSVTLGSEIGPGFDKFYTPPEGAFVELSDTIFGGPRIWMEGCPELVDGRWDTIVERQQEFNTEALPGTIEIELVTLCLKNTAPVEGELLGLPRGSQVDLYVTIDKGDRFPDLPQPDSLAPSTGDMTFYNVLDEKGKKIFLSRLGVFADVIVVVPGGNPNESSDLLFSSPSNLVYLDEALWDGIKESDKWLSGYYTPEPWPSIHDPFWNDGVLPEGGILMTGVGWWTDDNFDVHFRSGKHKGPHPRLSVTLDSFTAKSKKDSVKLKWKTGTEKDNAGFKVWRGEPVNGQCSTDPNNYTNVQAISPLVVSEGTEVSGATYKMTDSNVESGNTYCYVLEDVEYDGDSTFHMDDIVSATP